MMTVSERNDPDNKQKAFNVLEWKMKEEQKKEDGMPDYIRGDFFTPGSSGESTGTEISHDNTVSYWPTILAGMSVFSHIIITAISDGM